VRDPLNIFVGYDSKEPAAYHVLSHSILTRASVPVSITPLRQDTLRAAGIYTRERGPTESTEFSLTRFLVPYLSGYQGYSVFMDSDMLCRVDIAELYAWIAMHFTPVYNGKKLPYRTKAVLCCPHDYTPSESTKFLGNVQTVYPRKNWSSFIVFANEECTVLSPEYVNTATGLELHRFQWLKDEQIGALPLEWNHLVGEYQPNPDAKVLHFTLGCPCHPGYEHCDHAEEWFAERDAALGERAVA
jgi:hypothetical protein